MSATMQTMIAAPGAIRTPPAVYAGFRPAFDKKEPAQWVTWTLGDTAPAGATYRVACERLCESLGLAYGERVLNVTAGSGVLAAPAGESLPFRDAAFDIALSSFGAMFAPDHHRMADELLRVTRRGGRIGLAAWSEDSFNGQLIALLDRYLGDSCRAIEALRWSDRRYLDRLFGHSADALGARQQAHTWHYESPQQWLDAWRAFGGPLHEYFRKVDPDWRGQLEAELLALARRFNTAGDGSLHLRSDYLEFLVHKTTWRL